MITDILLRRKEVHIYKKILETFFMLQSQVLQMFALLI